MSPRTERSARVSALDFWGNRRGGGGRRIDRREQILDGGAVRLVRLFLRLSSELSLDPVRAMARA